ncbi:MAG: hypothetical protein AB1846_09725, partial [Chloroflexota bacterium]
LAAVFVDERLRLERDSLSRQQKASGKIYFPKDTYKPGEALVFPALDWARGTVLATRPGVNPEVGEFEVVEVQMENDAIRLFASGLLDHPLNDPPEENPQDDMLTATLVLEASRDSLEKKLEASLQADDGLVRIAGRWFPRALLVDVNAGHLNLAEAVLDVAGGEPLPTANLLQDVELPEGVNPKLAEFSLNYALQEDGRFDEVGAAGQVLWCLQRLEPAEVRDVPPYLRYTPIEHDRSILTRDMLALEAELDDELSESLIAPSDGNQAVVTLTYPHWRAGTLPVSARVSKFFPTAYESPRIRFTLVDGNTSHKMPAWVVREKRYVFGLREWYEKNDILPGSLITIRHSKKPGEVMVTAHTRRPTREWVRTVLVGADGGLVFALLKQMISTDFNDRMIVAVPDMGSVDQVWERITKSRQSFEKLVVMVMRELTKLNPQGHVHAQELYSALNILKRCPPAPLLALLASSPQFRHVGDLHFRMDDSSGGEA